MNNVRVIGGKWRGRKISFPDAPALRPTPDRVKETLFNWLMYQTQDARCLDAYAGSGALGLEALSRGAKAVVFLEQHLPALTALRQTVTQFQAEATAHLVHTDALSWLSKNTPEPFDIVFLDPPFQENLWLPTLDLLKNRGWLHLNGVVYLEYPANLDMTATFSGWQILKQKQMGIVKVTLLQNN